jgi:putative transposase
MSWRMDETYIRVKGHWCYLYRTVDKTGKTSGFLLTAHRDERVARHFLAKASRRHGVSETVTIDGSAANATAIKSYNYNDAHGTTIAIRQVAYVNNTIEQDHRTVKWITRAILRFKSVEAAQSTLAGVELMHMLKKGQLVVEEGAESLTPAEQFYALAA